MFNVVTIAREYGSGGAEVGHRVAEMMGWELVDKALIERVAAKVKVDKEWCEQADEHSSAWWERVLNGFRHGGPEVYVGGVADEGVDHDALQKFTAGVIEEAGRAGNCVLVGRSSQLVLQRDPQALHVLVYAPLREKLERVKLRHPNERDLPALIRRMDVERLNYAQQYFGCDSREHHLYHMCLNSTLGIDYCAGIIVNAIEASRSRQQQEAQV